jgi:hypothetical protein
MEASAEGPFGVEFLGILFAALPSSTTADAFVRLATSLWIVLQLLASPAASCLRKQWPSRSDELSDLQYGGSMGR